MVFSGDSYFDGNFREAKSPKILKNFQTLVGGMVSNIPLGFPMECTLDISCDLADNIVTIHERLSHR
jgi:hypothetical protein